MWLNVHSRRQYLAGDVARWIECTFFLDIVGRVQQIVLAERQQSMEGVFIGHRQRTASGANGTPQFLQQKIRKKPKIQ